LTHRNKTRTPAPPAGVAAFGAFVPFFSLGVSTIRLIIARIFAREKEEEDRRS
jgi:hypothetical protein